jgi:hypothetical protein
VRTVVESGIVRGCTDAAHTDHLDMSRAPHICGSGSQRDSFFAEGLLLLGARPRPPRPPRRLPARAQPSLVKPRPCAPPDCRVRAHHRCASSTGSRVASAPGAPGFRGFSKPAPGEAAPRPAKVGEAPGVCTTASTVRNRADVEPEARVCDGSKVYPSRRHRSTRANGNRESVSGPLHRDD